MHRKIISGYLMLFLSMILVACNSRNEQKEWLQLFNGKDLDNWDVKISGHDLNDNFGNTFRVDSGKLIVRYDQYDSFRNQFGHIFYKKKFSHYLLAVEYRFVGDQVAGGAGWATRNSGAMLHAQSAESMMKDQDFPISIEAQFLGGLGTGERPTANLCTPGTNVYLGDTLFTPHCINSRSKTFDGDQWVRVELLVLGDSLIRHMVNGDTVLEYTRPQIGGGVVNNYNPEVKLDGTSLTEGYIALQSESHPVEFRKVELLQLKGCKDSTAKNYKPYYIEADNSSCVY
ncbi:MAG TPA: DUF1080 domain-containing protein [Cyclobacteriaceae bacterium]|nr:DUF1080 domain-containing protein [Cyclobacteriaceae bacterium]